MYIKSTSYRRKRGFAPHFGWGFSDGIRQARQMDNMVHTYIAKSNAWDSVWYAKYPEQSSVFEDYFRGLIAGFDHAIESYHTRPDEDMSWAEFTAVAL